MEFVHSIQLHPPCLLPGGNWFFDDEDDRVGGGGGGGGRGRGTNVEVLLDFFTRSMNSVKHVKTLCGLRLFFFFKKKFRKLGVSNKVPLIFFFF